MAPVTTESSLSGTAMICRGLANYCKSWVAAYIQCRLLCRFWLLNVVGKSPLRNGGPYSITNHPLFIYWFENSDFSKARWSSMFSPLCCSGFKGRWENLDTALGPFLNAMIQASYCPLVTSNPFMDYIKVSANPSTAYLLPLLLWFTPRPWKSFGCVHLCFRCGERMPSCGQIGSGPFQPLQY